MTSNRIDLRAMTEMPIGAIARLSLEELKMLQDDISEADRLLKMQKEWFQSALHMRNGERATEIRRRRGKDTGTVRFDSDGYVIVCDLDKRVDWNQPQLEQAEARLIEAGENPAEYIQTERKVSEAAYINWPSSLTALFEPARTVKPGKPKYKIEEKKNAAGRAA